jgi:regulator of protease activity HflC (stomatin/prohibitin superfamily)
MAYLLQKFRFMALLIIGLIFFIIGVFIRRRVSSLAIYANYLRFGGLILMLFGFLTACFVQIGTGEIGVQVLFGSVQNNILPSGLHIVSPLVDVQRLDVKTQNYTMSAVKNEGSKEGDDAIRVLSADGLEVVIDLTVLYKVIPADAPNILRETGIDYTDKIVRPLTRTKIRDNAVYYDAVSLYSTKRDEFQGRIVKSIEDEFRHRGLLLEQLLIRNITLPQAVKTSIEQKISAEQDAQKMQFVLQKERQEAERKRVEAQGISDYQNIINASLTDRQLQYETIKAQLEIARSPNAKVIIMGKGNSPVILDTKGQ